MMLAEPDKADRSLTLLLILGGVFRLSYALEYTELPFIDAPLFDSVVYLHQAAAILDGRFGDASLLAFSPLYGWFLAAVGAGAIPLQLVLGVFNAWLVANTAQALFGRRAALASAALFLGYGLFPFYETKVLSETVGTTLALIALRLYSSNGFAESKKGPGLLCGLTMGAAVLARANMLLSLPFVVVIAIVQWGQPKVTAGERLRRTTYLVAGLALILGANGLFNLSNTGHFVPVILVSGSARAASQSEWSGNLRDASAEDNTRVSAWDVVRQAERRLAGDEPPAPPEGFDVGAFAKAASGKLVATFRDVETSFQYGYYGERSELLSLRLLPISFGVLGVLSLWAIYFLIRQGTWRKLIPLAPYVLGTIATTVIFHPSSRYRLPLTLVLVLLAGLGAERLWVAVRERRQLPAAILSGVAIILFSLHTLTYELRNPALWELRVAEGDTVRGDMAAARARLERARALAPDDPEVLQYIEDLAGPPGAEVPGEEP